MRTVRANGTVGDGRPVAYIGNRRVYAGDQVQIPDHGPVPSWATLVKKPDPSLTLKPGRPREVVDPRVTAADKRRAEEAAANGETVGLSELTGVAANEEEQEKAGGRVADHSPI